jgi:hypothetical protein
MSILLHTTFPRTLDTLVQRFADVANRGMHIEAWLFDDRHERRRAEAELAAYGVQANLRSAYKPLLHYFLEDLHRQDDLPAEVKLLYPVCAKAPANRFLLETYPLAALLGDAHLVFIPNQREQPVYTLTLVNGQGEESRHQVFAPNRSHVDSIGTNHLSPTGWLRVRDAGGHTLVDERLETEFEALYAQIMQTVSAHPWGEKEPYFEELHIAVNLPTREQSLDCGQEVLSLQEALHEDLYFSILEFFQQRAKRPYGDRSLQPGQIVPEVLHGKGKTEVRIETRPLDRSERSGPHRQLATADSPLTTAQIQQELAEIRGTPFTATSRAGRRIEARYNPGSDFPVMISGGQHANETSGVVGALRAARVLAARDGAHFTVSPLENPDGYALHQRLIGDNPNHMHHAARYTALGDDLGHRRSSSYESEIRTKAVQLSRADLHINLHGYPSHEWTRPLSGYIPQGFAMWTLPKGFFLIMNHHQAWGERAETFLSLVTERLATVPGLLAFNAEQMNLYRIHSGGTGFRIMHGFPCMITAGEEQVPPLVLTSEYPDETCHGAPFVAAHDVQLATVLAAYEAYQDLMLPTAVGGSEIP